MGMDVGPEPPETGRPAGTENPPPRWRIRHHDVAYRLSNQSPLWLSVVNAAIVAGYRLLSINVYLETHVFGVFRYGYGVVGPAETRLVLNTFAATTGALHFSVEGPYIDKLLKYT